MTPFDWICNFFLKNGDALLVAIIGAMIGAVFEKILDRFNKKNLL